MSSDWEITGKARRLENRREKPPAYRRRIFTEEVYTSAWYQEWGLDSELAGLSVVFDGLLAQHAAELAETDGVSVTSPLPWKEVYISTIWRDSNIDDTYSKILNSEAGKRGIPTSHIFGVGVGVAGQYMPARSILSRFGTPKPKK